MKLRQHWFQLAVIAILLMIWLEVGGDETVSRIYRRSVSAMADIGGSRREGPAPWQPPATQYEGPTPAQTAKVAKELADLEAAKEARQRRIEEIMRGLAKH